MRSEKVQNLIRDGVLLINDGYRAKNSELAQEGIPFARAGNIDGGFHFEDADRVPSEILARIGLKRSKPGDVVFTSKGTVGRFALVREGTPEFVYSPQLCYWRSLDHDQIDPRWLFYWMHGREFFLQYKGVSSQTDMAEYVSLGDQRAMEITLPSIEEQRAIARILGALDDKIELNRRMNATLEAMARGVFKEWFVDFGPVRAKMEGRKPEGMDEATAALFPDSFEDSGGEQVPKGWRVGSIYEIATVIYGAPFASSLFNAEKVGKPLIRIRDLADESPAVFTPEVHPKGYLLKPGDIAVGMDGEFRAYLWAGVESWLNQRVCVFAPKPGYSPVFVRNSIIPLLAQVEATETATTVIHLGKNDIDRFMVVIPDDSVVEAFKRQCQPWYDQIVANKKQSRILTALRDSLLPKLLNEGRSLASINA